MYSFGIFFFSDLSRASSFSSLQTRTTSSGASPNGSQVADVLVPVCMSADATTSRAVENLTALRNLRREISALGGSSALSGGAQELTEVHAQRMTVFGHGSSDVDTMPQVQYAIINGSRSSKTLDEEEQLLML